MTYKIIMKKQAEKKLRDLRATERERIADKIYMLSLNPDDLRLDIKKLTGEPFYRLRVGDWRVIYDRQDKIKIISIQKIKPRGDAYK